jgi:hypothetical protein
MGLTYEAIMAECGAGIAGSLQAMQQAAIQARGGHCLGCTSCIKLTAVTPTFMSTILKAENFSVHVSCAIDTGRKNPFRKEGSKREDCPSSRRHQRRHSDNAAVSKT